MRSSKPTLPSEAALESKKFAAPLACAGRLRHVQRDISKEVRAVGAPHASHMPSLPRKRYAVRVRNFRDIERLRLDAESYRLFKLFARPHNRAFFGRAERRPRIVKRIQQLGPRKDQRPVQFGNAGQRALDTVTRVIGEAPAVHINNHAVEQSISATDILDGKTHLDVFPAARESFVAEIDDRLKAQFFRCRLDAFLVNEDVETPNGRDNESRYFKSEPPPFQRREVRMDVELASHTPGFQAFGVGAYLVREPRKCAFARPEVAERKR